MEKIMNYHSPCGELYVGIRDGLVVRCDWLLPEDGYVIEATVLGQEVIDMLEEYFGGRRKDFPIPCISPSTAFAARVCHALEELPYGTTASYSELTERAGLSKGSVRAVAHVLATNRISILRPCHRIIPADGSVGKYRGGTAAKKYLLDLEKRNIR